MPLIQERDICDITSTGSRGNESGQAPPTACHIGGLVWLSSDLGLC